MSAPPSTSSHTVLFRTGESLLRKWTVGTQPTILHTKDAQRYKKLQVLRVIEALRAALSVDSQQVSIGELPLFQSFYKTIFQIIVLQYSNSDPFFQSTTFCWTTLMVISLITARRIYRSRFLKSGQHHCCCHDFYLQVLLCHIFHSPKI